MRRIVSALAVLAALLFAAPQAHADTCEDITMADTIEVDGETLVLNGMGIREATVFNVNVYVAGLYLPEANTNGREIIRSEGTKRMVLHFVRDVSREDMQEAITEGFGDIAERQARNIERFSNMLPNEITEGTVITFTFRHDTGVQVQVGSRNAGTVRGNAFARAFIRIWLGSNPPNRGLKRGLLGGRC